MGGYCFPSAGLRPSFVMVTVVDSSYGTFRDAAPAQSSDSRKRKAIAIVAASLMVSLAFVALTAYSQRQGSAGAVPVVMLATEKTWKKDEAAVTQEQGAVNKLQQKELKDIDNMNALHKLVGDVSKETRALVQAEHDYSGDVDHYHNLLDEIVTDPHGHTDKELSAARAEQDAQEQRIDHQQLAVEGIVKEILKDHAEENLENDESELKGEQKKLGESESDLNGDLHTLDKEAAANKLPGKLKLSGEYWNPAVINLGKIKQVQQERRDRQQAANNAAINHLTAGIAGFINADQRKGKDSDKSGGPTTFGARKQERKG